MSKILVCGLLNLETTVNVREFPVHYSPIEYPFNQVGVFVGGVGFNVAKALKVLGDDICLCSFLGDDLAGKSVRLALEEIGIDDSLVIDGLASTPTSVVLYDEKGDRKIYCDLKDCQEKEFPSDLPYSNFDIAVLANANFSRPLLTKAKEAGLKIATDVQALGDARDSYNADFMEAADILFLSNVCHQGDEERFIREIEDTYHNEIIAMGLGEKGALLYLKKEDSFTFFPAVNPRPVVSTVGAGDSLFSCFVHYLSKGANPKIAMQKAVYFAGYKIGEKGASVGFLSEKELDEKTK